MIQAQLYTILYKISHASYRDKSSKLFAKVTRVEQLKTTS